MSPKQFSTSSGLGQPDGVPDVGSDTSSIIAVRFSFFRPEQASVMNGLAALVTDGRVLFPREVIGELERYADRENPALVWAKMHQEPACQMQPALESVGAVLVQVPEALDVDKEGVEEADVYVLAMALELLNKDIDVRVVTEEFKTMGSKMNLGSAAGFLRIPSVSLKTLVKFEKILEV